MFLQPFQDVMNEDQLLESTVEQQQSVLAGQLNNCSSDLKDIFEINIIFLTMILFGAFVYLLQLILNKKKKRYIHNFSKNE